MSEKSRDSADDETTTTTIKFYNNNNKYIPKHRKLTTDKSKTNTKSTRGSSKKAVSQEILKAPARRKQLREYQNRFIQQQHQQYGKSAKETKLPSLNQNLKPAITLATIDSKATGTRKNDLIETVNDENEREIKREKRRAKRRTKNEMEKHYKKAMGKHVEEDECLK
ncbi:hypothetical protein CHS0354_038202 [Potamilus streckersoni]|uniref:Uncharacterized protein n=1 Tax=Potamilus streckersoni TaxID=2493646 RepID=A0AAE0T1U0_9BIVA|nr:hypothetical protein CHS0354_038202 [Potamilus streckersoni]